MNPSFWRGRRVLVTGHTGFKGAWLSLVLERLGAKVVGLALEPESSPNLWSQIAAGSSTESRIGDLRDRPRLEEVIAECAPELVVHLAAQALVRRGYREPARTFESNVLGTMNLLETLRESARPTAILVVTSDKVYQNPEDGRLFREDDPLGGEDPYSASKAACELVVKSYAKSFFDPIACPVATARAGNLIGGGDFAEDRLVPDVFRSIRASESVLLRNPEASRPWLFVLDGLRGYLDYLEALAEKRSVPRALNFGPSLERVLRVSELATRMLRALGRPEALSVESSPELPEKSALRLDAGLARQTLSWKPLLDLEETVEWTADWYAAFEAGRDPRALCLRQLERFWERIPEGPAERI